MRLVLLAALALSLTACSSQQMYGAGQSLREQECGRLADGQESARCRRENARSHDQYQRQLGALK